MSGGRSHDDDKGLLWTLPEAKLKGLGKVGPAFGFGAGCGVGFGVGFIGGLGFGPGVPGLQFGVGVGAGCGVGYGFGYGLGKGVAHDENRRYSNIGNLPTQDEIGALFDELVINTRKPVSATSREIEKRRR